MTLSAGNPPSKISRRACATPFHTGPYRIFILEREHGTDVDVNAVELPVTGQQEVVLQTRLNHKAGPADDVMKARTEEERIIERERRLVFQLLDEKTQTQAAAEIQRETRVDVGKSQ